CAVSPLVSPVATIRWRPGGADDGTVIDVGPNAPAPFVVSEPTGWVSNARSTTSVGPNPAPLTFVRLPAGPTFFDSEVDAAAGSRVGARSRATAATARAARLLAIRSVRPGQHRHQARVAVHPDHVSRADLAGGRARADHRGQPVLAADDGGVRH